MQASYFFYRLSEWVSCVLPRKIAYLIARVIAACVCNRSSYERAVVFGNLAKTGQPQNQAKNSVQAVYQRFGECCVDFLYCGKQSPESYQRLVDFENQEVLKRASLRGRGVIVVSLHLGNWELLAMALARLHPLTVIASTHPDRRVNGVFLKRRQRHHIKVVASERQSLRACLRALGRNEWVGLNADRCYKSAGAYVNFFGEEARLPKGPVYLSQKANAPIVISYLIPTKDRFRVHFEEPLHPNGQSSGELHQALAQGLERVIRRHPTYWYAFQEIWGPKHERVYSAI